MSYGQFNTFYRKIDGTVKSRYYANGSIKKKFVSKEEIVSYTATTQSTIITRVLEAKQNRDVMTLDIPNAVVQTEVHQENKKTIMVIRGALVMHSSKKNQVCMMNLLYIKVRKKCCT